MIISEIMETIKNRNHCQNFAGVSTKGDFMKLKRYMIAGAVLGMLIGALIGRPTIYAASSSTDGVKWCGWAPPPPSGFKASDRVCLCTTNPPRLNSCKWVWMKGGKK